VDLSQKDAIRSCLKLVLGLVSNDLAVASRKPRKERVCHTLSALIEILDDAEGYNEDDRSSLLDTFFIRKGLHVLLEYIGKLLFLDDLHPQVDQMDAILKFLIDSSVLKSRTDRCVELANSTMLHFSVHRFDEEYLTRRGDDVFDISKTVVRLYNHDILSRCMHHWDLSSLSKLHCRFIHRTIKSPTESVKLAGLLELHALMKAVTIMRPFPRAYIVSVPMK
jgi:hypothetical protein